MLVLSLLVEARSHRSAQDSVARKEVILLHNDDYGLFKMLLS